MVDPDGEPLALRVLVLAPTMRDARASEATFSAAGVAYRLCRDVHELCEEAARGAGAAVLTEEAILADREGHIARLTREQPSWSDFPLIVLTSAGLDSARTRAAIDAVGHTTLVRRPVAVSTLLSTVGYALRDRRRQYQARDHLREREEQAERLLAADRSKDEFLAMLAHELRNPLAAIANASRVGRLTRDAGELGESQEVVERQVGHLARMIDDLLNVSRITEGKIDLRPQSLDLGAILGGAIATARPFIEGKHHVLEQLIAKVPMRVEGDPVRLEQVFVNLLNNAAKYSPDGGRIAVRAGVEGAEAVVSIRDTGVGMTAELLGRAFDLFAQGDRSDARQEGGLGIGLTLVRKLVEMHGGTVAAASDGPGRGSELTVRLPLGARLPRREEGARRVVAGRSRRILVVDDNRDSTRMMQSLLRLSGHRVEVAEDGPSALEAEDDFRPEVILMDIGLPRMSGWEVARTLRGRRADGVLIVALSGYHEEDGGVRSREAGFDRYFVKPVEIEELLEVIALWP